MLVVNSAVKLRILRNFIQGPLLDKGLVLKLYSNDFTPTNAMVLGDITETTGGGYVAKGLTAGNWVIEVAESLTGYKYVLAKTTTYQNFIFSSPGAVVYGWYLIDSFNNLMAAERLPNVPFNSESNAFVRFTPNITLF